MAKFRKIEFTMTRENGYGQYYIHATYNVRVRFYLKVRRCSNTTNGNGYATYTLEWAWFKKRGSWWFYTQKLGNGDNGDRCDS